MAGRLTKFIDKINILSKHQYGFRKNRSTELAILDFTDRIAKTIDERKFTVGIFLDLSKTFDTINHKILISKLEHYGTVKYNSVKSDKMTSGVSPRICTRTFRYK